MPIDPLVQRYNQLLYGWHDLNVRESPFEFGIVDFDFRPRRDEGVVEVSTKEVAFQHFDRLLNDIPRTAAHAPLRQRVQACHAVLMHATGHDKDLDRLLVRTLGANAPTYSEAQLKDAAGHAEEAFKQASGGRFAYTAAGVAEAYRDAGPAPAQSAAGIRRLVMEPMGRAFGVNNTHEVEVHSKPLPGESAGWAATTETGRIQQIVNSSRDLGDNPGIPGAAAVHESTHVISAQGWVNHAGPAGLAPELERTLMFGPEQVGLEGLAETIPLWIPDLDQKLTPWQAFRFAVSRSSDLAWATALRIGAEGDLEAGAAFVDKWSPDASLHKIRRNQIAAFVGDSVLWVNRHSYIIGREAHTELANSLNADQKSDFLHLAARAPMTLNDIRSFGRTNQQEKAAAQALE